MCHRWIFYSCRLCFCECCYGAIRLWGMFYFYWVCWGGLMGLSGVLYFSGRHCHSISFFFSVIRRAVFYCEVQSFRFLVFAFGWVVLYVPFFWGVLLRGGVVFSVICRLCCYVLLRGKHNRSGASFFFGFSDRWPDVVPSALAFVFRDFGLMWGDFSHALLVIRHFTTCSFYVLAT